MQASRALELPHAFNGRSAKKSTPQKQTRRPQRIGSPSSRSGQRGWTGPPPSTQKWRPPRADEPCDEDLRLVPMKTVIDLL
jgi:hypothetical protein